MMAIVSTFLSKYRNIGVSVTISGNWYRENGDVPSSGNECIQPNRPVYIFIIFLDAVVYIS